MKTASIYTALTTLENLIIPTARISGHPFGPMLLHRALLEHPTVLSRDLIWSGPGYFEGVEAHHNRRALLKKMPLTDRDCFDGLPLIYAWLFTSLDSVLRNDCREALTRWGYKQPKEFVKLLELAWQTDDPQMKEDLMCCASGVSSLLGKKDEILTVLAKWVFENIFRKEKITQNRDVIVRQSARIVVERAFRFGFADENMVRSSRPPYAVKMQFLDLDTGFLASPHEQHYPITKDLAWYVFNRSYEPFFHELMYDRPSPIAEKLLQDYEKNFGVIDLGGSDIAMAAAIQLARKWGLNENFEQKSEWTKATHGSKSEIFTYEEKYVWCAVHFLIGYFSDYLPNSDVWESTKGMVKNYDELLYVQNPAQWIYSEQQEKTDISPTNISPALDFGQIETTKDSEGNKHSFHRWIHLQPSLDFETWLQISKPTLERLSPSLPDAEWIPLVNEIRTVDKSGLGRIWIKVHPGMVKKPKFASWKKYLTRKVNEIGGQWKFPDRGLLAGNSSATYLDPIDYVSLPWVENRGHEKEAAGSVVIESLITELSTKKGIDNEKQYLMLAKKAMKMLAIVEGNERAYFDDEDRLQAFGFDFEVDEETSQEVIYVDRKKIFEEVGKEGKQLFWIFSIFKDLSLKSRDVLPNYFKRHAWGWLVWYEDGVLKHCLIQDYDYARGDQ